MRHAPVSFLRSLAVGIAATALDLGILWLLVSGLGLSPRLASFPALALGVAAQFAGNKWFAFRDHSLGWRRQAGLFLGVEALGLVFNLVIFDRLIAWTPWPYLPCRLLSTALVYFALCLPLWARIFVRGAAAAPGP